MLELNEATRQDLLQKTKTSDHYKDTSRGKNRYARRVYSSIVNQVKSMNNINMNTFFKEDILTVGLNVSGETDDYIVKIKFGGVLEKIQELVKKDNNKLDVNTIIRALVDKFNSDDVYVGCNCSDFRYRQSFWATKKNYNSGEPETRASNITNPHDTKGGGCKHIMLLLANTSWLIKLAAAINNYIKYIKDNMQKAYASIIFPKIYGMTYNKAVQLSLFDDDGELITDKDTLDIANKIGKDRGKFKAGNQYRYTKQPKTQSNQLDLDIDDKADKKDEVEKT